MLQPLSPHTSDGVQPAGGAGAKGLSPLHVLFVREGRKIFSGNPEEISDISLVRIKSSGNHQSPVKLIGIVTIQLHQLNQPE